MISYYLFKKILVIPQVYLDDFTVFYYYNQIALNEIILSFIYSWRILITTSLEVYASTIDFLRIYSRVKKILLNISNVELWAKSSSLEFFNMD